MNRRNFLRDALTAAGNTILVSSDLAAVSPEVLCSPHPRSGMSKMSTAQLIPSTCIYMSIPSGPLSLMDPLHMYSVSQGALFSSKNAGASWKMILIPKKCYLLTAALVSRAVGWAAGNDGILFSTKNGGVSWTERQIDKDGRCLARMSFANERVGYVAGAQGALYRTVDGASWTKCDCPVAVDFEDLRCRDEMNGWAVGGGILLHTGDQGKTWNVIPTPTQALAVSPVDAKYLIVSCYGGQQYSTDQGKDFDGAADWFTKEGYYATLTAYKIAVVSSWLQIYKQELLFSTVRKSRSFFGVLYERGEHLKASLSEGTDLWSDYFDAVGGKLIDTKSTTPRPLSFAGFCECYFVDVQFR